MRTPDQTHASKFRSIIRVRGRSVLEMTISDPFPHRLGLVQLFLKFLRFGCLAFGGPVAQIGMIRHALVDEEPWISPARFNRLLAVMQILPGPEAHELCVHMGMMARGRIGGLLAGLGFMLPGFVLMLLAGWLYQHWILGHPGTAAAMLGIQIVVLAIILRAVQRIGGHALGDWLLWFLAGASFLATLAAVPFWIPLVAAGLVYAFSTRKAAVAAILLAAMALAWALQLSGPDPVAPDPISHGQANSFDLFLAGLKGGLLTFGGAYTAIPYVRADTVGRGWLSDASFLDGVALAGTLPAPLVIFATFAGYVAGGWSGAFAITAGMFLPAFAFSLILFERLEAIVENPALHRLLSGVAAAVVGVIGATWLQLSWSTFGRVSNVGPAIALFAVGVAAVWLLKGKLVTPALVILGGLAGWAFSP